MKARLLPLIKKEFIQIFRTKPMLAFIFVMPIVQTLLMGYAVTTEVIHVPLVICDQDRSADSRHFIQMFEQTEYFDIIAVTPEYEKLRPYFDKGTANAAVVIPRNFSRDVHELKASTLQTIIDGSNSNTAMVAIGYLQGIGAKFGQYLQLDLVNEMQYYASGKPPITLQSEDRVWYNPNFVNSYFMVPAIIGIILAFSTMILTAVNIVREREVGTLEQLMVSPLKSYQIMIGKLVPFALLGFVEIMIVMVAGKIYFDIPMRGSYWLLFFTSFLMLLTTLGLGLFVSTVTKTQQQSMFLAWFFLVFIILMSGFFFPIENMPQWLQYLSLLDPLRYYTVCLRSIFLKGAGLQPLLPQILALGVYGVAIISFAGARFQKRLA